MATFILSTVGTSLLGRVRREKQLAEGSLPEAQSVLADLNSCEPSNPKSGAEINSLASIITRGKIGGANLTEPFTLCFLVSDTEEGRWTGKLLADYWSDPRREMQVEGAVYEVVEDLQHADPNRFAREGLRNLVQRAAKLLASHQDKLRVINATGGYKAQISFAGLIGQTLGVPVVYMFEKFNTCIEMPPMPVDFSRELWLEHLGLFDRLSREGALEHTENILTDVDPRLMQLLDSIEENGRFLISLSPILELMHQGFLARWTLRKAKPPDSTRPPEEKLSLNMKEFPHDQPRERYISFARKLAEFPWVKSVRNVRFKNTQRGSHLSQRETADEFNIVFAPTHCGWEVIVSTTCQSEENREYCKHELSNLLLQ